MSTSLTSYVVL